MAHFNIKKAATLCRAVMCWLAVAAVPSAADAQQQHAVAVSGVRRFEVVSGAPVSATYSRHRGTVSFLRTTPGSPIPVEGSATDTAQARARTFCKDAADVFGLPGDADFATESESAVDEVGMTHVRLRLMYRGVPVTGGLFNIHLNAAGVVAASAVDVPGLSQVDTKPGLERAAGEAIAADFVKVKLKGGDVSFARSELQILTPAVFGLADANSRLAWFFEARGRNLRQFIWIDAATGELVLQFNALADARQRMVYDGGNDYELPGVLVRVEGGPPTGDDDADRAYDYAGDTYDYFLSEHGRDSYDDAGATLRSTVHHCPDPLTSCPYNNAFWDGTRMVYGEGFSRADDVVAHELTHAVTQHSANLFYCMESGALNESFSDVFGETVDLGNGAGNDTPQVRWLVGEDIPGVGAFRSMSDPYLFGQPASTSDPEYFCATSCGDRDRGGVHTNSGVLNHVYALVVDGGDYRGRSISGIGLAKAGRIFYRTLVQYLDEASQFADAQQALLQACADLVAGGGISEDDCVQLTSALDATAMAQSPCPVCGDGVATGNEECDDGNTVAGDGCDPNCTLSRCGNGALAPGEECDDGNTAAGDICDPDCTLNSNCTLFRAANLPKQIPDLGVATSTVKVTFAGSVTQVGVLGMRGRHPFVGDLVMRLTNSAAVTTTLAANLCADENDFSISFLDAGAAALRCPITDGQTHPASEPLWPLALANPNGTWTLTIRDTSELDAGTLDDWSLLLCSVARPTLNGCGRTSAGALASGAMHEYELKLLSPETVRIETTGEAGCPGDTQILLYTKSGDLIASDDDGGAGICSLLEQQLPAGTYVVRIRGFLGAGVPPYVVLHSSNACAVCGDGVVELDEECDDGDTTFLTGDYCRADCKAVACGVPVGAGTFPAASDALYVLRAAVGLVPCDRRVCDVNHSTNLTATDALLVLRKAVGQSVDLNCGA